MYGIFKLVKLFLNYLARDLFLFVLPSFRKRLYLKKEKRLKLQIHNGLFGGIYITDLGNPDFFKRVRRSDRKVAKAGAGLFLLVAALGVYLFWFM